MGGRVRSSVSGYVCKEVEGDDVGEGDKVSYLKSDVTRERLSVCLGVM